MPKAKDKTKRRRVDSDDEGSQATPQTQGKGKGRKQRQKSQDDNDDGSQESPNHKDKLSGAELERKVAETTRYLLFADRKKVPIKRADITKHALREHSRSFAQVMDLTKKQLKKVFGIEVAEIEGAGKSKSYILLDDIDVEKKHEMVDWGDDLPKMALLMVILSIILMSDNVTNETILWHFLKKLGLEPKVEHEVFGDPDKLITQEFTRQGYLEKKKVVGGEESTFEYRWGPRSSKELTKRKVLGFVSEMYGTEVTAWTTQLREIEQEERAEVEAMEE